MNEGQFGCLFHTSMAVQAMITQNWPDLAGEVDGRSIGSEQV